MTTRVASASFHVLGNDEKRLGGPLDGLKRDSNSLSPESFFS
jgi:hypothetical protein